MVVAQLVEWSLLTPEIHGLNPVNGKIYIVHWLLSSVPIEMTKKLYRKRGREWPILKKEEWTGWNLQSLELLYQLSHFGQGKGQELK